MNNVWFKLITCWHFCSPVDHFHEVYLSDVSVNQHISPTELCPLATCSVCLQVTSNLLYQAPPHLYTPHTITTSLVYKHHCHLTCAPTHLHQLTHTPKQVYTGLHTSTYLHTPLHTSTHLPHTSASATRSSGLSWYASSELSLFSSRGLLPWEYPALRSALLLLEALPPPS